MYIIIGIEQYFFNCLASMNICGLYIHIYHEAITRIMEYVSHECSYRHDN